MTKRHIILVWDSLTEKWFWETFGGCDNRHSQEFNSKDEAKQAQRDGLLAWTVEDTEGGR